MTNYMTTDLKVNDRVWIAYITKNGDHDMMKNLSGTIVKVTPDWYRLEFGRHGAWVKRDRIMNYTNLKY